MATSHVSTHDAADDPRNEAIDLAGISPDVETARKVTEAYKPVYDKFYREKFGIQILGIWPYSAQVLFCNGEIGPVGGRSFLHGFTASVLVFREP